MRIVLDTNVLISGLLKSNRPPAQVLNLILNKNITLLYDNRILLEYIEVLKRKKFGFKEEWIEPIIEFIKMGGEYVTAEPSDEKMKHTDDLKFVEVAVTGKADYIITGNKKRFPNWKMIISPLSFIDRQKGS